jgi:hypothetical protein
VMPSVVCGVWCAICVTQTVCPFSGTSGVPRNFVRGGGGSTNSVDREQRENGAPEAAVILYKKVHFI